MSTRTMVEGPHHVSDSPSDADDTASDGTKAGPTPDQQDKSTFEDDLGAVQGLARQYTLQTTYSQIEGNPLQAEPGSVLDPSSDNFNAKAYARALYKLQRSTEGYLPRSAGVSFQNLNAYGFGSSTDYQKNVANVVFQLLDLYRSATGVAKQRVDILRNFDGLVEAGEMLLVLGPPGSGCSTFLKTIAGEMHGYEVGKESVINYQGISYEKMHKHYRGEVIYTAEQDVHFPNLTVGETLYFAARARLSKILPGGANKSDFARHSRDVVMAMLGIRHTINTKIGDNYIRGVSGGERKRVSIAEAILNSAPIQNWDNSTRGLDSANAIEFCKALRLSSDTFNVTAAVAIYQAPQLAYDQFDKVIVLYEGRQIFFGPTDQAAEYFVALGFDMLERQTTPDFLTSMTSPEQRIVRPGFENRAPRSPDEFEAAWKASSVYAELLTRISQFNQDHPIGGEDHEKFKASRIAQQAKSQRPASPYTLSFVQQVKLCMWRGYRRLLSDPSVTVTQIVGNTIMALIIGSVFYNLRTDTDSFYSRGTLLFFSTIFNALASMLEILTLYAQRGIIEKHQRFALYHPAAEAISSVLVDMPYKVVNAFVFNLTLYFMSNLNRGAGPFFFFLLISFSLTMVMSMMFRTIASITRSLDQALAPATVFVTGMIVYTGFVIPPTYMLGWSKWIKYINPLSYGFESLMVNEFSGRTFPCSVDHIVPAYGSISNSICSVVGSQPGLRMVSGNDYINSSFEYYASHKWRNFGILVAFFVGLTATYLTAAELVSAKKSKGEILVFERGHVSQKLMKRAPADDEAPATGEPVPMKRPENAAGPVSLQKQTAIFQWHNICYDVKIKGEDRRILDNIDGWVKPGTLTALMGVSGAGKTTLLDVLATRITTGVIGGEALVDGRQRDASFQRKTGYVQQQDLHLATTTVREALNFSALLRQPAHLSRQEKLDYVDEVLDLLEMTEYAGAVVGIHGEGLNVEQRKRLTIGVELAAKPELLLFLDEPTSGLDSQTSWSILNLLEKLTRHGQAILCTIHQPSSILFQRFDRLLFLAKGGQTVYFGDLGKSSQTLIDYFERNGAHSCSPDSNPAEWMLEIIGAAPGTKSDIDWHKVWRSSPEYTMVQEELERLKTERSQIAASSDASSAGYQEFAASLFQQYVQVQTRVLQQYWRTPSYVYSKILLCTATSLFIGFSFFNATNSRQGLQNQMFSIFELMSIFGQLVQQVMPLFVTQRSLYEVRERPSKTYSWKVFLMSNIVVELPWNLVCAVLVFVCWYYPIGLYRNAEPTDTVHERGFLMFLFVLAFLILCSTFSILVIAGMDNAETGGNIANLLFLLTIIFCGIFASPDALPGFWIFMYRVSPFNYLLDGMITTAVSGTNVTCASNEYLRFNPPSGQSCAQYMERQISQLGGYLQDPQAMADCSFCTLSSTDAFLASFSTHPDKKWRNFGLLWAFIAVNVAGAVFFYWLFRVPKGQAKKEKKLIAETEHVHVEKVGKA